MTVARTARFGASPAQVGRMGTEELRAEFLILGLFAPAEARLAYTHLPRMVVGGIVAAPPPIAIGDGAAVGKEHLFQGPEEGITNPANAGATATREGTEFGLASSTSSRSRGARATFDFPRTVIATRASRLPTRCPPARTRSTRDVNPLPEGTLR